MAPTTALAIPCLGPKTVATNYHTHLGFPDKGRAIKELIVCWTFVRVIMQKVRFVLRYSKLSLSSSSLSHSLSHSLSQSLSHSLSLSISLILSLYLLSIYLINIKLCQKTIKSKTSAVP